MKGRIQQKGTPEQPRLIFVNEAQKEHFIDLAGCAGASVYAKLKRGERVEVWVRFTDRRVSAVARDEAGLAAFDPPPPLDVQPGAPTQSAPDEARPARPAALPAAAVTGPRRVKAAPPPAFHNPYNFVPFAASPRPAGSLGDAPPPGHQSWRADRWHGRFEVELTLITPLLLADAESAREPQPDSNAHPSHRFFPVLNRNGLPWLASSSLKGAVRSAYECVTASRMPRFDQHDSPLGYRSSASSGLGLKGARVSRLGPGLVELQIFEEASLAYHVIEKVDRRTGEIYKTKPPPFAGGGQPAHGEQVYVRVERKGTVNRVLAIERRPGPTPPGMVPGYAYITGRNIRGKSNERVFYGTPQTRTLRGDEATRFLADWADVVKDYRDAHDQAEIEGRVGRDGEPVGPDVYLGDSPGKTAWSKHLHPVAPGEDDTWARLREGSLTHVAIEGQHIRPLPVMISRRLFTTAPVALVPDHARPAGSWPGFSPADRVFGWVSQDRNDDARASTPETRPYKGHVRIGPVTCQQPWETAVQQFTGDGLPLAILAAPKPRQARFYVGRGDGSAQDDGLRPHDAGYLPGKRLRGIKVYPHHLGLPRDHWEDPTGRDVQQVGSRVEKRIWFREYRRIRKGMADQRDSQNRSVLGWVNPTTRFRFTVEVDNLNAAELGALLWLLHADPGRHLRLGGGKPLGFGSAAPRIIGLDLATGAALQDRYRRLDAAAVRWEREAEAIEQRLTPLIAAFEDATRDAWGETPAHILAWQAASRGFADRLPVAYPRANTPTAYPDHLPAPHPDGKSFEWYVENNAEAGGGARHGFALDDLATDRGLPVLISAKGGGGTGRR